jgi:tRNA(fMet)-specific endonuclease VapC
MVLLDTNICIYTMKYHPPQVRERLLAISPDEVAISAIVLAELRHGVAKSQQRERNEGALEDFLQFCQVLDWPEAASAAYAEIRTRLEMQGNIIGANDLLIAAHALHLGAILVTNNLREFERIPDLRLENWV